MPLEPVRPSVTPRQAPPLHVVRQVLDRYRRTTLEPPRRQSRVTASRSEPKPDAAG